MEHTWNLLAPFVFIDAECSECRDLLCVAKGGRERERERERGR
jgi:hypothetical protein